MVLLHSQTLISKNQYAVDKDSFLPIFHAVFDEVLAKAISKLLKDGESVIDVGALDKQDMPCVHCSQSWITVAVMGLGMFKNTREDM